MDEDEYDPIEDEDEPSYQHGETQLSERGVTAIRLALDVTRETGDLASGLVALQVEIGGDAGTVATLLWLAVIELSDALELASSRDYAAN